MGKRKHRSSAVPAQVFTASPQWSIGDPAFAEFLRMSGITTGQVTEDTAAGLTAYYRAEALIAGTIAGLPLKVYEGDGSSRREVDHFLSTSPAGPYDMAPFNWVETVVLHLLNHAEAYLKSITNGGGELVGLYPVHPLAIDKVEWAEADKLFTVALKGGGREKYLTGEMTQVLGMSMDGLRGMSPLTLFRKTLQTSMAAETAANRSFTTGALISGLVTTEEDMEEPEAVTLKEKVNAKIMGAEHAGEIVFVNRSLKFSPWAMSNVDAQFLESRGLQVTEVARIFGLPLSLMSVIGAVSNWGTGVAESFLGLQKFVLTGWTSRIESALRAVLPPGQFAEFDYAGLLQGSPKDEIELLIAQVNAGILTKTEARAIRNLPPLPEAEAPAEVPAA
jgi:HK97 family phage portal protein